MPKHKLFFFSFVPVELAAITVAILIYCGIVTPVNRNTFLSLLPNSTIHSIDGTIDSNPVKTSSNKFYSMQLKTTQVATLFLPNLAVQNNNHSQRFRTSSTSSGNILLLVNAKQVESLYPGKLFTENSNNSTEYNKDNTLPLFETGAKLHIKATWIAPNQNYLQEQKNSLFSNPHTTQVFIAEEIEHCGWTSIIAKFRAYFRLAFRKVLFLWGDAGGLLLALLSGTREYTNSTLSEAFKNAGLSHILALSGMHLSLFAGLAKSLGKYIGGKRFSAFLAPIMIILFVWFAGFSPSLFRAFLCTFIGMLLSLCFLSSRFSAILAISFLIQIILFPQDTYSPAFILSYSALTGIILGEKLFALINYRLFPTCIASSLTASEGAQICTAPITAGLFGSIMPIGIISSVVVSPLAAIFLVLGLCSIIIAMILPVLMQPLGIMIQFLYTVLENIVLLFAQFPHITL